MALTMERESKKRRFNLNDIGTNSDTDIDHDDVKMEKFFALIRSANDIRGQLMGHIPTATATMTTTIDRKVESAVWQPSFRPEDFGGGGGTTVIHTDNLTAVKNDVESSSRGSKEDGENKAADQSNNNVQGGGTAILLDLNLSL